MMQSQITTMRAIGSEFLLRKLKKLVLIGVVVGLIIFGLIAYAGIAFSGWFFILLIIFAPVAMVPFFLWVVLKLVGRFMVPQMSTEQRTLLSAFVDKLERVAEHAQTPVFVIMFRIAKDILMNNEQGFIRRVTDDSTTLRPEYDALQLAFTKPHN